MKICLRYLSPKNRHFVLLAAKVHWTICSIARDPLSERGLTFTSFRIFTFYLVIECLSTNVFVVGYMSTFVYTNIDIFGSLHNIL